MTIKFFNAPLKIVYAPPPWERDPQIGSHGFRFNNRMSAHCIPINYKLMQFTNFN